MLLRAYSTRIANTTPYLPTRVPRISAANYQVEPNPEIDGEKISQTNAFALVTLERTRVLVAEDETGLQHWVRHLSKAIEADSAALPDKAYKYTVKAKVDPTGKLHSADYMTSLRISHKGVTVHDMAKHDNDPPVFAWTYLQVYQWCAATHEGKPGAVLTVKMPGPGGGEIEQTFFFRSKEAARIIQTIEFFGNLPQPRVILLHRVFHAYC
jgi:hypothetical protein